ncbi:ABC transporter ATP-binding protein [Sphingosinicella rhizophila]|uniref:ABC transporter ATP-binding protein n=1 Tax=Sphingosinicella rhizophila TaxID=3050082 RepID=A0ABU3Q2P4_9SPHN|nr:ABC transporter ATP-binding protein [Sphingosinicella sp. GR2756]MDT9597681.1 ABC transporter ATP-binding protein [Sphingosinicella sp. GR2756]
MTYSLIAEAVALPNRLMPTDLALESGALVCLIGPNGSGKTSLLHALAGIGQPTGSVTIEGEVLNRLHPDERRRLFAFLPASRDANWPLSVAHVAALGLPSGAAPDAVDKVLDQLGLADLATRRIDHLSTGERSRVLIARALVANPKLLLLDEPVANLDPLWQLRLMDHLRRLAHEEKRAILLAVHDLDLAGLYADRLIIMNNRQIAADGDPATLLAGSHMPAIFGIERKDGSWRPFAGEAPTPSIGRSGRFQAG